MNLMNFLLEKGNELLCSAICVAGDCLECMAVVPNLCPGSIMYEPEVPEEILMELINRS